MLCFVRKAHSILYGAEYNFEYNIKKFAFV